MRLETLEMYTISGAAANVEKKVEKKANHEEWKAANGWVGTSEAFGAGSMGGWARRTTHVRVAGVGELERLRLVLAINGQFEAATVDVGCSAGVSAGTLKLLVQRGDLSLKGAQRCLDILLLGVAGLSGVGAAHGVESSVLVELAASLVG